METPLGSGTAVVYKTPMIASSGNTNPVQRAESLAAFRLWRDLGYAFGAFITGVLICFHGLAASTLFESRLTLLPAFIINLGCCLPWVCQ